MKKFSFMLLVVVMLMVSGVVKEVSGNSWFDFARRPGKTFDCSLNRSCLGIREDGTPVAVSILNYDATYCYNAYLFEFYVHEEDLEGLKDIVSVSIPGYYGLLLDKNGNLFCIESLSRCEENVNASPYASFCRTVNNLPPIKDYFATTGQLIVMLKESGETLLINFPGWNVDARENVRSLGYGLLSGGELSVNNKAYENEISDLWDAVDSIEMKLSDFITDTKLWIQKILHELLYVRKQKKPVKSKTKD